MISKNLRRFAFLFALAPAVPAMAVGAAYDSLYDDFIVGPVPGMTALSSVAFLPSNPNTLLVAQGDTIRSIGVTRGAGNHITGFTGTAAVHATATGHIIRGMTFDANGLLLFSAGSSIGQIKPGSTTPDKVVNLDGLPGYVFSGPGSTGTLTDLDLNPTNPSKVQMQLYYNSVSAVMHEADLTPDGNGTYNVSGSTGSNTSSGNGGRQHAPANQPLFPANSLVLTGNIGIDVYSVGANGLTNGYGGTLSNNQSGGAAFDPVTRDLLYVVQGTTDRVFAIQLVPEPGSAGLLAAGVAGAAMNRRTRRRA